MSKRKKYVVEVSFTKSRPSCAIGMKTSGYLMCGGRTDSFNFGQSGFKIEAERSAIYADGSILSSDRNGLYGQILKGLLVYYALSNDFPKVKKVKIIRKRNAPYSDVIYSEGDTFQQPVIPNKPRTLVFSTANISELLEETEKGTAIRIAMTYWLKATNSSDPYFKFDRLWKAYDRLLLYEGNTVKQIDGIRAIKAKIVANVGCFSRSIALVNTFTDDYIRSFSWNHLLSSKSMSYTKPCEICRRAIEYSDSRAIRLFQKLLSGGKISNVLVNAGLRTTIDSHFRRNTTTRNDIEIVLLMSLSYTYYIRCRLFHGEVPDSTFKLKKTNEDREIEELVKLLELVVFELIESNQILR